VIIVTRLNGAQFGVNPDLLQRVDSAPDTILTLIDGTKYIVRESMAEVIARVNEHRAQLLARAQEIQAAPAPTVELVRDHDDDAGDGAHDGEDDGPPLADPVPLRPRSH
jgi:flagellar protein FlbD